MRHHSFRTTRVAILATALFLVAGHCATTHAEELSWNGSPVLGVARLAPLDRLQRDFEFLADGISGGDSTTQILDMLTELSAGIDPRRPAGAAVYFDETYVPMIFVPVKDAERLFAVLGTRFGWEFRREADDLYRFDDPNSNLDIVARVAGTWLYATGNSNRDKLQSVPDDPTVLFHRSDPTLTAYAAFNFDQFPEELRAKIAGEIGEASLVSGSIPLVDDGTAIAEQMAQRLFAETKSLQLELQCFRPLKQFHVTTRLTAVPGSRLEQSIADASRRTTLFSHLASSDSILAMISSIKVDADTTRQLLEAWEPLAAQAKAGAPSSRSRDSAERLLGLFVERGVNAVTATIQPGQLNGGFAVERQGRDQVVVLAATTLKGARAVEEVAIDIAQLFQQSADFRAMQWAMGQNGDVSIHKLNVPATDIGAQTLLGNPVVMAIGVGADQLYTAFGGDQTLARLSDVVERAREESPERGEVFRLYARMAPLLALLDTMPGDDAKQDAEWRELAAQIAPFKKNDTLELSLKAVGNSLEGRLQIDMGVVQALAHQVPVSQSPVDRMPVHPLAVGNPIGVLRLQAGEQFQFVFNSKSEVTTDVDGNDRLDQSNQSQTYDFRVDRVDADDTMHIATSMSRMKIDKTSPEGRMSFDSENLPDPEEATPEMTLYALAIGQTFVLSVRPDGTIVDVSDIEKAIENVLDKKLQPPPDEREQARAFVSQILNADGLRDSLTRGFEFYPGEEISQGGRWERTTENLTLMNFLLDNRYQVRTLSDDEIVVSVRSQIREPDTNDAKDQPVRWEVVGSQSGTINLDPNRGLLQSAQYTLRLDAEATFEMEGKTVSRPIIGVFEMTIGTPQHVAE